MEHFTNIKDFLNFVENQKRFHERATLDNMICYCKILGNPEKYFKSIHVTGTNGKGSVVSYLLNQSLAYNLRVGSFTSPYIVKFNERICFNGNYISDEDLLKYGNIIIDHYPEFILNTNTTPSFFEFITLLAFLYFKDLNLDVAIIEVGIGGLFDSTNVINSCVSVIVNVDYDHMNVLGNTLEEILINKLGIVKNNQSLVVGIKDTNLIKICNNVANSKNTILYTPLLEEVEILKSDLLSTEFLTEDLGVVKIQMLGLHQVDNALVAIKAFKLFLEKVYPNLLYDTSIIKEALYKTKWIGRLEVISKKPLIIIDGAHNENGIKACCDFFKNLKFKTKRCIFACSDNKEKAKMLEILSLVFDEIVITSFTYKRHSSAKALYDCLNHPNKILIDNLDEVINYVYENPYELNLFIGSLYFISEIRPKLLSTHN